jgi:hypothetical protein
MPPLRRLELTTTRSALMANERRYGNQDMDWRDREDDG